MNRIEILVLLCLSRISFGEWFLNGTNTASSDFKRIVNTPFFVDKTNLISAFFQPDGLNALITAPRRFGKSTNLDMLKRFCEINIDKNGSRIPKETTENFKIFSSKYNKTGQLEYLDIYKNSKVFNSEFGEYPVIYVDFGLLRSSSYSIFIADFMSMLKHEFNRHYYLLYSYKLNIRQRKTLTIFYDKIDSRSLSETDLLKGFRFLTELLFTHFDRPVIVLIDEYDSLVQNAVFLQGNDFEKTNNFVTQLIYNLLKTNKNVDSALLNACIRLSGFASVKANNIQHFPFLAHHNFNTYYGFTQEEVSGLLAKFQIKNQTNAVMQWYDGYFLESKNIKMYNVWSIVNYLESKQLKSYWTDTGCIKNLEKLVFFDEIRVKILEMLDSRIVKIFFVKHISIKHIECLKIMLEDQCQSLNEFEADLLLQFMTDNGYFDIINVTPTAEEISAYIKIPNYEIFSELRCKIYNTKLFKIRFNLEARDKKAFINAVLSLGNADSFIQLLEKLNGLFTKQNVLSINEAELAHVMFTFLKEYDNFALVNSELSLQKKAKGEKSSPGIIVARYDGVGIILELKRQNPRRANKVSAITALNQSIGYYSLFDEGNYKKFVTYSKILIGVYMDITGNFSICYLVNNQDMENKTCVP